MTSTTTPTTRTTAPTTHRPYPSKDRTMSPNPSHLLRTALTATATFLGLLLLVALWTVYGPTYDAQATPITAAATDAPATEPCPAGEATGGTCGTEGQIAGPSTDAPSTSAPDTQRRCKGCRLTQEEYDARQADKQAAHDRAEARKQRGADRRAEAQRKREERAARKSSKSSKSSTSPKSTRSHASKASESSSDGSDAQDGTSTPDSPSQAVQDAPEASTNAATSDDGSSNDSDAPSATAPYTPLEIPEASRRPAPYDASKDPFEVRREAARQAADAINHSSDQVKAPSASSPSPASTPASAPTPSSGYWAEQMPTWALGLIGFLAASGLIVYKISRPRGDRRS